MKIRILVGLLPALSAVAVSNSDRHAGERPPVSVLESSHSQAASAPAAGHAQRLYVPGGSLIEPGKAAEIVDRFRAAYERLGRPRLVLAVNRELVEEGSGLRLSGRKERVESYRENVSSDLTPTGPAPGAPGTQVNVAVGGSAGGPSSVLAKGESASSTEKIVAENTYTDSPRQQARLADRQTVRDLERLFGRPLRAGGAVLVDQRVVASLLEDKAVGQLLAGSDEAARKDRAALAASADAVLEILVSSRALNSPGLSGDQTYDVPDIQATLVRLQDGAILGQASAADILGKDRYAGPILRAFDVNDIAEATALALMEDLAATVP